ncbi:MAG: potassium channel protein [Pyrinomonadaceae bacterium]|nr:potassium channel protein [Acidobacteriota bacterium]MBK7934059.1 potassium channel protein [Acidobacteriota bacterium]MBP7376616.1 potassium channel protein [Pyrinomonadaceae bacterium]
MTVGILATLSHIIRRRLAFAAVIVGFIIVVGASGFRYFEGFSWLDSFYTSAQTVTTVGYGDLTPVTKGGRFFAILLMLTGAGTVLYALTVLAQAVIQSEMVHGLDRRRKLKEMEKLEGHYIVCGAGRVGRRILRNLERQNLPHVIIERDEHRLNEVDDGVSHIIVGDATSEENLIKAGVRNAKGLASCLPDDAANVYVVLTARGLNPALHIVARAVEEQAEPTLIRAGASRVVAPTIIGSQSMARALLKPAIADFMDSIVAESLDLVFEEVAIDAASSYAGKLLKDTNIMSELSLIVVAVRRKDGELAFQPKGDTMIEDGDLLIVIGKAESVQRLVEANR